MMMRRLALLLASTACLVSTASGPWIAYASDSKPPPKIDSAADDKRDTFDFDASGTAQTNADGDAESAHDGPQDKYVRADKVTCVDLGATNYLQDIATAPGACDNGDTGFLPAPEDCEDYWLPPLWVQRVQDGGTYAAPEQVDEGDCVTPADLAAEAQRELKTMKITAPEATMQGNPPMVVNVHYPAYTTAATQDRTVTLLEVPVVIRADPAEYTWDFDDPYSSTASTLTTTDPGRPWRQGDALPDSSWVGHTYSQLGTPGENAGTAVDDKGNVYRTGVAVTLTTTWQGRFRIQGTSDWTDIPGTISTTSTTDPTTVTEARTRLVCEDLEGNSTC